MEQEGIQMTEVESLTIKYNAVLELAEMFQQACCGYCKHNDNQDCELCDFMCDNCTADCACKTCIAGSKWEWGGVQNDG